MVSIDELTDIPKEIREEAIRCLDELLTYKDEDGNLAPIISGYNWYRKLPIADPAITLTNIHESEDYKEDMFADLEKLGYKRESLEGCIREKTGIFFWRPTFNIRETKGKILPGLRIKNIKSGELLNLSHFSGENLLGYPELDGNLKAEDHGWEINIESKNTIELVKLAKLFTKKGLYRDKEENKHWRSAYRVPVIILGKKAADHREKLKNYYPARKFSLRRKRNEISFIIEKNLSRLKESFQYTILKEVGFEEELCLANIEFIKYINGDQ